MIFRPGWVCVVSVVGVASRPGEFVLDPFAGSGSTCVAAALCGRRFMGVELDVQYHKLAVARLAELAQRRTRIAGDEGEPACTRAIAEPHGLRAPAEAGGDG